jgi:hypothetical protein
MNEYSHNRHLKVCKGRFPVELRDIYVYDSDSDDTANTTPDSIPTYSSDEYRNAITLGYGAVEKPKGRGRPKTIIAACDVDILTERLHGFMDLSTKLQRELFRSVAIELGLGWTYAKVKKWADCNAAMENSDASDEDVMECGVED